jgi:acyl-CoA thioesterase-1
VYRLLLSLFILGACSKKEVPLETKTSSGPVALFIGDSVTAGYGVDPEEAWPALVGRAWAERGSSWQVRNAAVSGATSAGISSEINWALTPNVKLVFICIGGNDGLRGVPPSVTQKNLNQVLTDLKKKGVSIALAGMKIPPNYGDEHANKFAAIFPFLAQRHKLPLLPFLLEGVAGVPALNQEDGIHPNEEGHRRIAHAVTQFIDREGLLK